MKKLVMLWLLQLMMMATMKVVSANPPIRGYGPANLAPMDQAMQIYDRLEVLLAQASCADIELVVPNRQPDPTVTGNEVATIQVLVNRLEALEPLLVRSGVSASMAHTLIETAHFRLNALIFSRCGDGEVLLYHGVEK